MARSRERIPLEDGLKLDLNHLIRDDFAKLGESRGNGISWNDASTGDTVESGALRMRLRREGSGIAVVSLQRFSQIIGLVAAPRHFGGSQWYFVCPMLGRKAAVLWCPPGANRFQSRQAWGREVAYASQFETWNYRALRRAQKIRYRLGGLDYLAINGFEPPKPKGMHWRTYAAQLKRAQAYELKCDLYLEGLEDRLEKMGI
jgi:hypothetical protein